MMDVRHEVHDLLLCFFTDKRRSDNPAQWLGWVAPVGSGVIPYKLIDIGRKLAQADTR